MAALDGRDAVAQAQRDALRLASDANVTRDLALLELLNAEVGQRVFA